MIGVAVVVAISFIAWNQSHKEEPTYQALGEASSEQQIKNVETFTKLFGYVRYFHPSDEVDAINWNKFAVYGIEQVMSARDRYELKDRLKELFYPLAPTMNVYRKGKEPDHTYSEFRLGEDMKKVFWQHKGVEPHETLHSRYYQSQRVFQYVDNDTLMNPIFDRVPENEVVQVALGQGIYADIPITLYSESGETLGSTEKSEKQFAQLQENLNNMKLGLYGVQGNKVKWAGVAVTWNVVQHFHPAYNKLENNWRDTLSASLKRVKKAQDIKEYTRVLQQMLAPLQDGNVKVQSGSKPIYSLPVHVQWVEGQLVVRTANDQTQLQVGDVLLSRDGVSVEEFVEKEKKYISGTPHWKHTIAGDQFIRGTSKSSSTFEVLRDGQKLKIKEPLTQISDHLLGSREFEQLNRPKGFKELEEDIWYINAVNLDLDHVYFRDHIKHLQQAKGVIIDLRGNLIMDAYLLRDNLVDKPIEISLMNQLNILYPDHEDPSITYSQHPTHVKPREPRIDGDVVLLTSHRTQSMSESFIRILKESDVGEVVGQSTKGDYGGVMEFQLPNYITVSLSMSLPQTNQINSDTYSIQPDYHVETSLKAIHEGRDEYIEKALQVIKDEK